MSGQAAFGGRIGNGCLATSVVFVCLAQLAGLGMAADVQPGSGLLAYSITPTCPPGWTDQSSSPSLNGRLILATATAANVGKTSTASPVQTDSTPTHSHATWSLMAAISSTAIYTTAGQSLKVITPLTQYVGTTNPPGTTSTTAGATMSQSSSYLLPYITLTLCRFDSGTAFELPTSTVALFDSTVSVCPNNWVTYTSGEGRFLTFGTPTVAPVSSPTAALSAGTEVGIHTHTVTPTPIPYSSTTTTLGPACCNGGQNAASPPVTIAWTGVPTIPISSASLNIPYVALLACQANVVGSITNTLPSQGLIFLYDGSSCPSQWNDVYSSTPSIAGRLLWSKGSSGTAGNTRGSAALLPCGTGTCSGEGHLSHSHFMTASDISWSTETNTYWAGGSGDDAVTSLNAKVNVSTSIETASTGLVPYRALRACSSQATPQPTSTSPMASPTFQPTPNPTAPPSMTSAPSSQPTHKPTARPIMTSAPSSQPTHKPTSTLRPSSLASSILPTPNPTGPMTSQSPTTSSNAAASGSSFPIAAVGGGVAGGLALAIAGFIAYKKRQRRRKDASVAAAMGLGSPRYYKPGEVPNMNIKNSYTAQNPAFNGNNSMVAQNQPYPQQFDVGYSQGGSPYQQQSQSFDQRSYSGQSSNSQPHPPPGPGYSQQGYLQQQGYYAQQEQQQQGYYGAPSYSEGRFSRPVSQAVNVNRDTWNLARPETAVVATCLHDFRAENPDEINMQAGERLAIILQADPDWVVVRNERGEVGLVPLNHIQ